MGDEKIEVIKEAVKAYLTARLAEEDGLEGLSFNVSALGINFVVDINRRAWEWQAVEPIESIKEQ